MDTKAFQSAYERLNASQKEAVDTIEGPVLVIAGPGTGKTQILTLRIANILLKTDTPPENILALTFTESGARAMRERLQSYIGNAAYRVSIHTFHEFAGTLIRAYPDAYERAVGGRPATDLEKVGLIEDIIDTGKIKTLRPNGNPTYYVKPILSAIALMKREYITPDAFKAIIEHQEAELATTVKIHEKGAHKGKVRGEYHKREKELKKNRELLYLYRTYDSLLSAHNLFDFEDMIFETVRALERNEDMLRDLQERFLYILADEHQDVNGSQNRILELLASFHDRPNVFVVGDEKQAIFRFQGASLENFLYFEERFPHTKTIALTNNYRSRQNILNLAHSLITQVDSPAAALRIPLEALPGEDGFMTWASYPHAAVEDDAVVSHIETLLKADTDAKEIAIILRSNREVEAYATALRKRGVTVAASADGDILHHPITTTVRSLIKAVLEPSNETALFSVLHYSFWQIPREDLVNIFRARSFSHPLAKIISDDDFLQTLSLREPERIRTVAMVLRDTHERLSNQAAHRVLEHLLTASGFIDHLMRTDPQEGGRVLRRLYDEIEALVTAHRATTLTEVDRLFSLYIEHGLPLSAPYIRTSTTAVTVMTAHKSKGLEFEHVFVPHLTDARWGDTTPTQHFKIPITKHVNDDAYDSLDDERKLLYVAMTRAKIGLYLSYATENSDGRSLGPSPLMADISPDVLKITDTADAEASFNPLSALAEEPRQSLIDISVLRATLAERGISATALNNYVKSPWIYLYRNVFRMPSVQDESLQFGTALHNTMRRLTTHHTKTNTLPEPPLIKQSLEAELERLPLSVEEYTRLHERGFEAILRYVDTLQATWPARTEEERHFEARLPTGLAEWPEVFLTGSLDRLDFDDDGRLMRVIDYKSGKPRTRGYIEGTTKDSNGDYKRQLTFYALLLSLQSDDRLHTKTGCLSFLEADEKGNIHEEEFIVTEEEIATLKTEIIRVTEEITNGAFLNAPCDATICEYCDLVESLKNLA